jgi:hypothetical protein
MACSLQAPALAERLRAMEALGRAALLASEQSGACAVLRFAPGVRDTLEDIVAAEAECCPFLVMTLSDEPDVLVLTVEAPADAEALLVDYVSRFGAGIRSSIVE